MVEKIEQNLLAATSRAQTAEERVATLERQLASARESREDAAVEETLADGGGSDDATRQLLRFYRGKLRLCAETGEHAHERLARSLAAADSCVAVALCFFFCLKRSHLRTPTDAFGILNQQAKDMKAVLADFRSVGRVALVDMDDDW